MRIAEFDTGCQGRRDNVTIGVQPAVEAPVNALRQRLVHPLSAQAVLTHRGGAGRGPIQAATGGIAFSSQCRGKHARTEKGNPLAPQSGPGSDRGLLHRDVVAVQCHDPCRDVAGSGLFRLSRSSRLGGVIRTNAPISRGKRVTRIGVYWHAIRSRGTRTSRVRDRLDLQTFCGSPLPPLPLARRGSVLISIGVPPGAVQSPLAIAGPLGCPLRGLLLSDGETDRAHYQLLRLNL
ncbi:hypothetical protein [Mycolicibacterium tusciae]|uniref:hypothetical protein n=1 Tax=Mycolicibacterium tusciae TaxID=75922 RepID=UPI0009F61A9C|nr:hypothetical protein [Mycolicibacterium tusciae]